MSQLAANEVIRQAQYAKKYLKQRKIKHKIQESVSEIEVNRQDEGPPSRSGRQAVRNRGHKWPGRKYEPKTSHRTTRRMSNVRNALPRRERAGRVECVRARWQRSPNLELQKSGWVTQICRPTYSVRHIFTFT